MENFKDSFVIKERESGKAKELVEELPEDVNETNSEIGSDFDFPLERDIREFENCSVTISLFYNSINGKVNANYKKFNIDIKYDENSLDEPSKLEDLKKILEEIRSRSDLKDEISEIETYKELEENKDLVTEFERISKELYGIWSQNTLKPILVSEDSSIAFEIKQFPQGFFQIPRLYNRHTIDILDDELGDKGKFSLAWRGFIVKPENFYETYKVLKPFYGTPEGK